MIYGPGSKLELPVKFYERRGIKTVFIENMLCRIIRGYTKWGQASLMDTTYNPPPRWLTFTPIYPRSVCDVVSLLVLRSIGGTNGLAVEGMAMKMCCVKIRSCGVQVLMVGMHHL
jgi:hypothetical protein